MCGHTYNKSMDQPGNVVNPARGQLETGQINIYFSVCCDVWVRRLENWWIEIDYKKSRLYNSHTSMDVCMVITYNIAEYGSTILLVVS